jgi:hypothetical protein
MRIKVSSIINQSISQKNIHQISTNNKQRNHQCLNNLFKNIEYEWKGRSANLELSAFGSMLKVSTIGEVTFC